MMDILLQDLKEKFSSARFYLGLSIVVCLMVLNGVVYSIRYRDEMHVYQDRLAAYSRDLRANASRLSRLATMRHLAIKPPWKLAFLAHGGQSNYPNAMTISLSPGSWLLLFRAYGYNSRLRHFEAVDWTFIAGLVLPLLAMVLAYDAVCGEKESGTLRLVLANPVSRHQIIAAKFASAWLCAAVPFLVGALPSIVLLKTLGQLDFTQAELVKILAFIILALVGVALFCLLSLLISASCHNPVVSLVILLFSWLVFASAVPNAAGLAARIIKPLPSQAEVNRELSAVLEEVERGGFLFWRDLDSARSDNFRFERVSGETRTKTHERQEAIRMEHLMRKIAQAEFEQKLALLSPTFLLQDSAIRLVGSGLSRDRRFLEQVQIFRVALADYFRRLDMSDPESPHIYFFADYMSHRPVDSGSMLLFQHQEAGVEQGINAAKWHIAVLCLLTLIAFSAADVAFLRYDVR